MTRLIKRYGGGSRKLYDTEESRYVSLEEIERWIRQGQELKVVDSATGEDVTAQTLAQVIYEGHKNGTSRLAAGFLHDVIRRGSRLVKDGVTNLPGAATARAELDNLRRSLKSLEASIANLEHKTHHRRSRRTSRRKS